MTAEDEGLVGGAESGQVVEAIEAGWRLQQGSWRTGRSSKEAFTTPCQSRRPVVITL